MKNSDPVENADERANLRLLFKESLERNLYEEIYELWEAVSGRMWNKGYWYDYLQCGLIVLNAMKKWGEKEKVGQLTYEMAWSLMERHEYKAAQKYFFDAYLIFNEIEDSGWEFRLLRDLGSLYLRQDRLGGALKQYNQAQKIVDQNATDARPIWRARQAEIFQIKGSLYLRLHEFYTSQEFFLDSINIYKSLGHTYRYFLTAPLLNYGRLKIVEKDYSKARKLLKECYDLSQDIGRRDMLVASLLRLADVEEELGNFEEVIKLAEQVEQVSGLDLSAARESASTIKFRVKSKKDENQHNYWKLILMVIDLFAAFPKLALKTINNYRKTGIKYAV